MEIQTERLQLKPICRENLGELAQLLMNDVVKKTYMVPDFANLSEALKLADRIRVLSEDPSRNVAGIYLGETLIGILNETDRTQDSVEVGYALLPAYYNQGYATEALRAVFPHFFAQGFRSVVAGAFEENAASIRVMVKSGMRKEDRQDNVEYRGKNHRCVYYSIEKTI